MVSSVLGPGTLNESPATRSPPDSHEGDVSEPELGLPDSSAEESRGDLASRTDFLQDVVASHWNLGDLYVSLL